MIGFYCLKVTINLTISLCLVRLFSNGHYMSDKYNGDEHVKKMYSTAVIDNEDAYSNHRCTGEHNTTCAPWPLHRRTHCEYWASF